MDTPIEEKRKILQCVIDNMIVKDMDCDIALCDRCDDIMIFDSNYMESGSCESCHRVICKACGGLRMVKDEDDLVEQEEVENDEGEIKTILNITFGAKRFLCDHCV